MEREMGKQVTLEEAILWHCECRIAVAVEQSPAPDLTKQAAGDYRAAAAEIMSRTDNPRRLEWLANVLAASVGRAYGAVAARAVKDAFAVLSDAEAAHDTLAVKCAAIVWQRACTRRDEIEEIFCQTEAKWQAEYIAQWGDAVCRPAAEVQREMHSYL